MEVMKSLIIHFYTNTKLNKNATSSYETFAFRGTCTPSSDASFRTLSIYHMLWTMAAV